MAQPQVIRAFFNGTGLIFPYEMTKDELFAKIDKKLDDVIGVPTSKHLDDMFRRTAKMQNELYEMARLHGEMFAEEVYEIVAKKDDYGSGAQFINIDEELVCQR